MLSEDYLQHLIADEDMQIRSDLSSSVFQSPTCTDFKNSLSFAYSLVFSLSRPASPLRCLFCRGLQCKGSPPELLPESPGSNSEVPADPNSFPPGRTPSL